MNRARIILIAIVLAIIGAITPVVTAFYLSWVRTVQFEQKKLADISQIVVKRAEYVTAIAKQALVLLNNLHPRHPCSVEHIYNMRKIAFENPTVQEAGFFENNALKCTTWGDKIKANHLVAKEFVPYKGIKASFNATSQISQDKHLFALRFKNYYVLIDPFSMSDITIDPSIKIILSTDKGDLIPIIYNSNPLIVDEVLSQPKAPVDDNHLFFVLNKSGFIATAMESRLNIYNRLRNEQFYLLPLGLLTSLFIISVVIFYSRRRLSLASELTLALKNHAISVHYQPIIILETGLCAGAEALARWRRTSHEEIAPDVFIPLAEERGLISILTKQVISKALHDLGTVLSNDRSLHLSINLSSQDIHTKEIIQFLVDKLANTGILNHQIWLEITERGFKELNTVAESINYARHLGFVVAIDDFGTGYSSLSYLQHLSLDLIKIDKSFVNTINTHSVTSNITPHIIAMSKTLNMDIIAEGIENNTQLNYLMKKEVKYGQGWLFSKALPAKAFIAYYINKNKS